MINFKVDLGVTMGCTIFLRFHPLKDTQSTKILTSTPNKWVNIQMISNAVVVYPISMGFFSLSLPRMST